MRLQLVMIFAKDFVMSQRAMSFGWRSPCEARTLASLDFDKSLGRMTMLADALALYRDSRPI